MKYKYSSSKPLITVTDIKQYFYCPIIPYFNHVLDIWEPTEEYEKEGKEAHEQLTHLEERRKTILKKVKPPKSAQKYFRIKLHSPKLNLTGILDCLIVIGRQYIPVEYKHAKSLKGRPHPHHKYQLTAYVLLVEHTYTTIVRKAYIYYHKDNKLTTIHPTHNMRQQVIKAIQEITKIIQQETEPKPTPHPAKCKNCNYKTHCPYSKA